MIKEFKGVAIRGISAAVPRKSREIREVLAALGDEPHAERMIRRTGIERVRVTGPGTTASDLCHDAATRLLRDLGIQPKDVGALVFVSPTPDYLSPPTSHILQFRLGLPTTIPCFDLTFGCSGYIYALLQAALLISSGTTDRVLLLVGETPTKSLRNDDRSTVVLFGDAGSATVLERSEAGSLLLSLHSDGSGYRHIIVPNSAFRKSDEESFLIMDGVQVFAFASREVPPLVTSLLMGAGLPGTHVDWYVFHQANKMIVDFCVKKLRIAPQRALLSLSNFGNTGCASIPLTMIVDPRFRDSPRRNILLCGFGVGLSWGAALSDFTNTHLSTLTEID